MPRRTIGIALGAAGLALGMALVLLLIARGGDPVWMGLILLLGLVGFGALMAIWTLAGSHSTRLNLLRAELLSLDPNTPRLSRRWFDSPAPDPLVRLARTLHDVFSRRLALDNAQEQRFRAIVESLDQPVVVVNGDGLISLINAPALRLLGNEQAQVRTSIFNALDRGELSRAMRKARERGRPVRDRLPAIDGRLLEARVVALQGHRGAVVLFSRLEDSGAVGPASVDLSVHDQPPVLSAPPDNYTLLDDLPVLVLDVESTGLNPQEDRVISIGAVRCHGRRVFAHLTFDQLVNPGVPIPPASTAVHGLDEAMLADARTFPAVFRDFLPLTEHAILLGHNVAFDLTILFHECRRHGLEWQPPRALDTWLLAACVLDDMEGLSLDAIAARLDIDPKGRHTALGDSLVTAEIHTRLIPLLQAAGAHRLGDLTERTAARAGMLAEQKRRGWLTDPLLAGWPE